MVNFGLNAASLLGIFLAVAGASLYFMRSVRPELSRDHDIFFAAVGLLCGFILLFQGWRLDPILQFSQVLLSGSAVFFAVESIRLRKVATEQARRNTPTVDRERPVSRARVYTEAELDRIEADEYEYPSTARVNYNSPRLRGYEEPQTRSTRRVSNVERETKSYRSRNRPEEYNYRDDSYREDSRTRRRPSSSPRRDRYNEPREPDNRYDAWEQEDRWNEPEYPSRSAYDDNRYDRNDYPPSSRRQPVNPRDLGRSYDDNAEASGTDYVDYQPLDLNNLGTDYQDNNDWERDNPRSPEQPSKPDDDRDRGRNPINFDY